jgi:PAS domain S-box-containing protein
MRYSASLATPEVCVPFAKEDLLSIQSPELTVMDSLCERQMLQHIAAVMEQARIPMTLTDPCQWDNPIVLANQAFLGLTGYQIDEVVGRNCNFLQGDGTSTQAISAIRSALDSERDFVVTLLNYQKSGTPFWNELRVTHISDSTGDLSFNLASLKDVSESVPTEGAEFINVCVELEEGKSDSPVPGLVRKIVHRFTAVDADSQRCKPDPSNEQLTWASDLAAEKSWRKSA